MFRIGVKATALYVFNIASLKNICTVVRYNIYCTPWRISQCGCDLAGVESIFVVEAAIFLLFLSFRKQEVKFYSLQMENDYLLFGKI